MSKEKWENIRVIGILLLIAAVWFGVRTYNNRHIEFEDREMANTVCDAINEKYQHKRVTPENITYKDIKKVKELQINYWDGYESLKDLQKCVNLQELCINDYIEEDKFYTIEESEYMEYEEYIKMIQISDEQQEKYQKDLMEVMPKLTKLQSISIYSDDRCQVKSIAFLAKCINLRDLTLFGTMEIEDYSALRQCKNLEIVRTYYTNISNMRDFIYFDNLVYLVFERCPAAVDIKQKRLLERVYPEAVVRIGGGVSGEDKEKYFEQKETEESNIEELFP